MLLQHLREYAQARAHEQMVADVRIGLCYTAVLLDDGSAGVAYTFKEALPPGCDVFQGKRPIAGKPASETLSCLSSTDLLERAVGIATANALINTQQKALVEGDILKVLDCRQGDRVGMVGFFPPLMPVLKQTVKEVLVFEKILEHQPGVYQEDKAPELLPFMQRCHNYGNSAHQHHPATAPGGMQELPRNRNRRCDHTPCARHFQAAGRYAALRDSGYRPPQHPPPGERGRRHGLV